MVMLHVPVPVQAPLHPEKLEPLAGVAVRVTVLPPVSLKLQPLVELVAQLIPPPVIVPLPVPSTTTVSANDEAASNSAVTFVAELIVTVHVPVPEHPPPDHPVKPEPLAGVAVRTTVAPLANGALQVAPQDMPAGAEVTVPEPVPVSETVRRAFRLKNRAVAVWSTFIVTVHAPWPAHPAPDHPPNSEPLLAVAVRVTGVPAENDPLQD